MKVDYKGLTLEVIVDGAGLDIIATDEASLADISLMNGGLSHELFCKVFDFGYEKGLANALAQSGATILDN